jgi:large subunit ribosomal protein L4
MSSILLSVDAAKSAGFSVVENGRYTQALHETVVAYRASRRSGTANTRTKAEVSLSGSKPWRQKGTGRARAGYKSSPVWVGGGVVFGPKPRSYRKGLSRGVRQAALRKALSLRIISGDVVLAENFEVGVPKTKVCLGLVADFLGNPLPSRVLVVGDFFTTATLLSARNLDGFLLMRADEVTAEDILLARKLIVTRSGLSILSQRAAS